jgi:hypothetical protein
MFEIHIPNNHWWIWVWHICLTCQLLYIYLRGVTVRKRSMTLKSAYLPSFTFFMCSLLYRCYNDNECDYVSVCIC